MFDLIVGLGQGGCRIATEFAHVYNVQGRYINLADVDFSMLRVPKSHTLVLGGDGTGRNPKVGEVIARENIEEIQTFIGDAIECNDAEYVVLCVGGGGGSGTGMLFPVLDYLKTVSCEVLLVFTLPEKREGLPAKPNALKALNRLIHNYVNKKIPKGDKIAVMLVDNDFCYNKYGANSRGDYWGRVNRGVAKSLKRFHDLTNYDKMKTVDIAGGYGALDFAEFERILFFKEGFLDIREVIIDDYRVDDLSDIRKSLKTGSLIFGSLDIRTTKAYIISIALPETWKVNDRGVKFTTAIFDLISKSTQTPFVLRSSFYTEKVKKAKVSLLLAGMVKSHGLEKILRQTIKDTQKYKQKESVQELDLSDLKY